MASESSGTEMSHVACSEGILYRDVFEDQGWGCVVQGGGGLDDINLTSAGAVRTETVSSIFPRRRTLEGFPKNRFQKLA